MPRTPNGSSLDRRIHDIIARAVQDAVQAVRQSIVEEVNQLVSGRGALTVEPVPRKRRVITCPVPGCGKPGGGPKWGWFCSEHKDLPESEKDKARAARNSDRPDSVPVAKSTRKKK